MQWNFSLSLLFVLAITLSPIAGHAASFDCAKAASQVEKMICEEEELSSLDDELAAKYRAVKGATGAADQIQRDQLKWLAERNACGDAACIKAAYTGRLATLRTASEPSQPGKTTPAESSQWPRMEGDVEKNFCARSLALAEMAFRSSKFSLGELPKLSPDLLGGAELWSEPSLFEKLPRLKPGTSNALEVSEHTGFYWQLKPQHGFRLVMNLGSLGWRGTTYAVYALPVKMSTEEFNKSISTNRNSSITLRAEGLGKPLLLQEKSSGELWILELSNSEWAATAVEADGTKRGCQIQFRPPNSYRNLKLPLLPEPVQKFAQLLDSALGSGKIDGTLNSTARRREKISDLWWNLSLRPWASLSEPYNTRAKIDKELTKKARDNPGFRKTLEEITNQYALAESSLAKHYIEVFSKKPDEASALAKKALDNVYREHFVFPRQ
jgi:uncharacterized protein